MIPDTIFIVLPDNANIPIVQILLNPIIDTGKRIP